MPSFCCVATDLSVMIVLMNICYIYLVLVMTGLCFGSFAGATVWRLRFRQLNANKLDNEPYDKKEYNRLNKISKTDILHDRSKCLDCSYTLQWYDMLPLLSWLFLGGKCRKCRKPIGWLEPLIELGVMSFFVISFAFWPHPLETGVEIARFIIWLVAGVGLSISFTYDKKWGFLPDVVAFPTIFLGAINSILVVLASGDKVGAIISTLGAVLILSGLYLAIYLVSQGKWIGYGDIKLGLSLALLLADWKLAFVALFTANLVGSLVVLPGMITNKLKFGSHVPFGPLLIVGFVIAGIGGGYLVEMYSSMLF